LDDDAIEQAVKIALGEEDGESEEDAVNEAVRKGLRKSGLSDDAVSEIVDRVLKNRREAAADRLPANGLANGSISGGGFGGFGRGHKNGGYELASDSARFDAMYDTARLRSNGRDGNFGHGTSNKRREAEEDLKRRRRPQRMASDRALQSNDADYLARAPRGCARPACSARAAAGAHHARDAVPLPNRQPIPKATSAAIAAFVGTRSIANA
jgi:hypothetical protein